MSLTRSMLKGMGLTEEQVGAIIEEHANTVSGLKAEIERYKSDATKLSEVQKELDGLKSGNDDWKAKFEKEHKAFEDFKADAASKETLAKVRAAYRQLLTDSKVGEKHIDSILRVTDFGSMKLDKDGKLEGADKLTESIKADYSGFITSEGVQGAKVDTPPSGGAKQMTREQIYAKDDHGRYKLDATQRQTELAKLMTSEE